jgi:hypothetical protein
LKANYLSSAINQSLFDIDFEEDDDQGRGYYILQNVKISHRSFWDIYILID